MKKKLIDLIKRHQDKLIADIGVGWCREMATTICYLIREQGEYARIAEGMVISENRKFCIMSHEWVCFEEPKDGMVDLSVLQANATGFKPLLKPFIGKMNRTDITYGLRYYIPEGEFQRRLDLGLFLQDGRHFSFPDYIKSL